MRNIPGLSPQWKAWINQAWEISRSYRNSREDLMRAIADRNLRVQDLQKGLPYLQSGPVASILNMVSPGLAGKLHDLGTDIVQSAQRADASGASPAAPRASAPEGEQSHRRENPFPALKHR